LQYIDKVNNYFHYFCKLKEYFHLQLRESYSKFDDRAPRPARKYCKTRKLGHKGKSLIVRKEHYIQILNLPYTKYIGKISVVIKN